MSQPSPIPLPDPARIVSWTPEEQLLGYQNMDRITPVRQVARDANRPALPLRRGKPLNLAQTAPFLKVNRVRGLLVLQGDAVRLEYRHPGVTPGACWASFSVTKSVTGLLVGIALAQGLIRDLDDPVDRHLPELAQGAYAGIAIRHLLSMTSGVDWSEDYLDPHAHVIRQGRLSPDPTGRVFLAFMAGLSRAAEPGQRFNYSTGETNVLGHLVRRVTNKPLAHVLSETVWGPMGMERDAFWLLDKGGNEPGGHGLCASLHDLGRLGRFILRGGKPESGGLKRLPENWPGICFTPTRASVEFGKPYGLQWWIKEDGACQARGIFGQMLHIHKELDLVIVQQSTWNAPVATQEVLDSRQAFLDAVHAAL